MRGRAVIAMLVASVAIAGCGSAKVGSPEESSAPRTPASQQAAKRVAELVKRPTKITVPALPHRPPRGKQLDYVSCGLAVCLGFAKYIQQAAEAVGWKYKLLNAGETPQTIATAYSQAVADHPAGVIGSGGFSPTLFVHQLRALRAEHVPVVLSAVSKSVAQDATTTVAGTDYQAQNGYEAGQWILDHSHGHNAHVAIFTTPETPVYASAHAQLKKVLLSGGCQNCSVDTYSFPEGDIGQALPNEVVSYLNRHQDVKYLFFDFNSEVDGVPAALIVGGLSGVNILCTDATPTEYEYLTHDQLSAVAGLAWPEMFWGAFNVILSQDQGVPLKRAELAYPHMLLTAHNLPTTTDRFPLVANYRSAFERAWHVG